MLKIPERLFFIKPSWSNEENDGIEGAVKEDTQQENINRFIVSEGKQEKQQSQIMLSQTLQIPFP